MKSDGGKITGWPQAGSEKPTFPSGGISLASLGETRPLQVTTQEVYTQGAHCAPGRGDMAWILCVCEGGREGGNSPQDSEGGGPVPLSPPGRDKQAA